MHGSCFGRKGLNPFPNDKFKTRPHKDFADHNFKFNENGRKFSKLVEHTVGKGEQISTRILRIVTLGLKLALLQEWQVLHLRIKLKILEIF